MNFVIDRAAWICGNPSENEVPENCHGNGKARLLNAEAFQCCLGQVAEQCGVPKMALAECPSPKSIPAWHQTALLKMIMLQGSDKNSELTMKAMKVNDDMGLTRASREAKLRALFNQYGHELVFKGEYNVIS